jgi:6-hydroxycyclohex-1-ene-1-carbonyl-CoA dehydrogenase
VKLTTRQAWTLVPPGEALEWRETPLEAPAAGEVVVRVAGCGVCHTDLGFYHGHVPTRSPLPIVLGHEISGTVVDTGADCAEWQGKDVLVAAVIPCGDCDFCRAGRGNVCRRQTMPGNDRDGGFADFLVVPATGLTEITAMPEGYALADFSVIADAVTTPLQAVHRAAVDEGDFVVVNGTGGVGTYAVQIAAARGAKVLGIDVNSDRLEPLLDHGADVVLDVSDLEFKEVRDAVRSHAADLGCERHSWKIFECSGTPAGQETAFGLMVPAGTLAVVGFTPKRVTVRLSNLMAFDATAFGSWGCPPELYPEAVDLVVSGRIDLQPFIRRMPLADIAEAFAIADAAREAGRVILVP